MINLKKHMTKRMVIAVLLFLSVGISIGGYFYFNRTYDTNSFSIDGTDYECSRPITFKKTFGSVTPKNVEDLKNYCRAYNSSLEICGEAIAAGGLCVEEYRAVIDILKREDVSATISKYGSVYSSVRVLGHTYINDKNYLNRILPNYNNVVIDCIIVVHSPEGTRFFIESGEIHESHDDHRYIEIPADEFLSSLNSASDEDVTAFWLGLH